MMIGCFETTGKNTRVWRAPLGRWLTATVSDWLLPFNIAHTVDSPSSVNSR